MSSAALTNRRASSSVPWPIDLGARERVLERARQVRQVGEADRRRAAGERMRQRDRHFADRSVQLHRPFGDLGHEAARQLVGLVEIDVEERDADAQRPDDLDVLVARRLAAAASSAPTSRSTGRRPIGRRAGSGASPVDRSSVSPAMSSAARARFARRQARISPGASAALPRSRSTSADGIDRTARWSASSATPRCARRRSDRTSPTRRPPSSVERPGPRLGGAAGLARRSRLDEVELERQVVALGLRGGRLGCAQVEVGAARQVGRHADRQGDVRRRLGAAPPGELGGSGLDLALVALAGAVRCDVLDPVAEIAERPVGEIDQRRLGGALLGELGVEELLARPGGLAEVASARPSASCP